MKKIVFSFLFFSFTKANVSDLINVLIKSDEVEQSFILGGAMQDVFDEGFIDALYELSVMKSFDGIDGIVKVNVDLLNNLKFFNRLIIECGIKGDINKDYQWSIFAAGVFTNNGSFFKTLKDFSSLKGSLYVKFDDFTGYVEVLINKSIWYSFQFGVIHYFEVIDHKMKVDAWIGAKVFKKSYGDINLCCGVLF